MEGKEVTKKADGVTYQAADGQEVTLTLDIVKKYLVQGKGELVTMQEFMYFVNICRARKLNPLVKDCYLVKYNQDPAAIITSIDFYRKRARAQKDCKGWKKGCIVKTKDGAVKDTFGLVQADETLLGGWFESHPEGWLEPFRLEVNLAGYIKKTSDGSITKFWRPEMQPTMIMKVAEAQGLRTLWTDEFQGIYAEEEISGMDFGNLLSVIDVEAGNATESDLLKKFDASIVLPRGITTESLDEFLRRTAESNKTTIEAVKLEAAKDGKSLAGFWKYFLAWEKQEKAKKKVAPKDDIPPDSSVNAWSKDDISARFECPADHKLTTFLVCAGCKAKDNEDGTLCDAFIDHGGLDQVDKQ